MRASLSGLAIVLGACGFAPAEDTRPSFVVICTDDQGVGDVGCFGSEIPTPHIDSLAGDGMRFARAYVAAPVCTPSRFGLLTGRHPNRSRDRLLGALMFLEERDRDRGIRAGETTLASVLGASGYDTALIGKWHLGHGDPSFLPTRHGFETFYGHTGGCVDYVTKDYGKLADWYRGEDHVREDGYATDLLADEAARWIEARSAERPFFLYLPFNAPHFGKGWDAEAGKTRNILQGEKARIERFAAIEDPRRREYAAMVASLDDGVGRVLAALRRAGRERNTLVVFLSDNGADPDYGGSNRPLRGRKTEYFEGGIRVPCIARWPGRVPAGVTSSQILSALDVFPTFCRLAGVDVAARSLDGIDLSAVLGGGKTIDRDLVWTDGERGALRRGSWKFVRDASGREAIFDLANDPAEASDLSAADRESLEELRGVFDRVAKGLAPVNSTAERQR